MLKKTIADVLAKNAITITRPRDGHVYTKNSIPDYSISAQNVRVTRSLL